ncbi:MAG: molybdotransferase-like divisome protein Glp [Propionibacteriaceae bacterium]
MPLFGRRREPEATPRVVAREPLPVPPAVDAAGLRSLTDHRDYLLACVAELPPFRMQLLDAVDLSITEDVIADIDLPGFDNSAMDGYAVHADDVAAATDDAPVVLPVVGEIAAGQSSPHQLSPGATMKIMTGAPMPPGSNAVVAYELTDRGAEDVRIFGAVQLGQHVRRQGEDVARGSKVISVGDPLGPRMIGLLAAVGRDQAMVRPRPRIVVISTGTELVEPGRTLNPDEQIYDSNSYLLAAAAKAAGAQVFRVGLVSDDPGELAHAVSEQLVRADLIVTTGGVSQGDYDVVKEVMPELGVTDFAGVAMQPGKPQGFGLIGEDRIPMIMLPGNPVSAFVSFEIFVRPVIRKLMGTTPYTQSTVGCVAAEPMRSIRGKTQAARGIVTVEHHGARSVRLVGGHGSHLLGSLARANALVLLPPDVESVAVGDQVEALLLGGH